MMNRLQWFFDLSAAEWSIILAIIIALMILAFMLIRRSTIALYKRSKTAGKPTNWHQKSIDEVFKKLDTSEGGLSTQSVVDRLTKYGPNRLPETKSRGALLRFLFQFHNVLIYVLLVACLVTALLEHWVDSGVILAVVFLNALIGFVQEGKAENALRAIKLMLSPSAMLLRDGRQTTMSADELVPGDVVLLQSGDKVPADLRLFRAKGLQIQESVLTGESMAVEKSIESVAEGAVIGDQRCMAFSGTLVTHGQGRGVVVETGAKTQIGLISTLVSEVESVTTPLFRQMAKFSQWLTLAIIAVAAFTFMFATLIRDYALADMFLAAVSLAVAAIPEGLPAIMTITLAIGVQRMAQRHAIIRKLPAVETLGAVTVICSDKTGTLTKNEMTVRVVVTSEHLFELTGTGYDPHGEILLSTKSVPDNEAPLLLDTLRAGVLCNEATLDKREGDWRVHGDPMEGALLVAGLKAGIDIDIETKQYPLTDLIPFESEHRFMATLNHSHTGEGFIFLKGAPERVLEMCLQQKSVSGAEPIDRSYWLNHIEKMAQHGQRILAIAFRPVSNEQTALAFKDVDEGLIMLGLFGLIDPPRDGVVDSVDACKKAGIRVKMITGDHASTALAIARKLGLINTKDVLTGQVLESMSDHQLRQQAHDVDVYARVNPEHKLRLVKLMQDQGLIVAMTGDGVNDAPALKRANIGTAMGLNGTEAAKEAAEMVLADDDFRSIVHAVEEGRTVYDNLKKAILFILPTNGGEALIILAAILLGFHQLPLTPVQILWVNMATAVTLALSLAFEPPESKVMQRPPRRADEPMLTPYLLWRVVLVAMILMVGTFGLFTWYIKQGFPIEYARTVAVNTLVMFEIFYLFNSRYITASVLNWKGFVGNRYVLIAIGALIVFQLGFTYLEPMQSLFGTSAIGFVTWLWIILVASSVLFLVELEKFFLRSKSRSPDGGG